MPPAPEPPEIPAIRAALTTKKSAFGFEPLAVAAIIITGLYVGRDLLVPLALAILLTFALVPLVSVLRRWRLGRIPSTIIAVLFAFGIITALVTIIGSQLGQLADELPQYQGNISEKIRTLRRIPAGTGTLGRASGVLKELSGEITQMPSGQGAQTTVPIERKSHVSQPPIPVEIHRGGLTPIEIIQGVLGPLLQPMAMTAIVIVFAVFFLLQRDKLRGKFIRLLGLSDLQRTTRAIDDATGRLSRYLFAQCVVNATFGLLIGIGLKVIGIPNPILWGILAMMLRFVPYIGPAIAAFFPAALALAVDPGWSMLLWTGALFLIVEPIIGQGIEPFLYGHSTGLSPVAVIVAASFWTWLWGPIGLLLSTPLTLCLVVLGRHVQRLEFLDVLLGDKPALTPDENFYNRILADDVAEILHQAEEFLKQKSLIEYYDEVVIAGLWHAEVDVHRNLLDHDRRVRIKDTVLEVTAYLADHGKSIATIEELKDSPARLLATPSAGNNSQASGAIMCVGGRGSLDEAAAALLAQLLQQRGFVVHIVPSHHVSAAKMHELDLTGVSVICLSYLDAENFSHARYLVRRLRRKASWIKIVVGFWTMPVEVAVSSGAVRETGADFVVTTLKQAGVMFGDAPLSNAPHREITRSVSPPQGVHLVK